MALNFPCSRPNDWIQKNTGMANGPPDTSVKCDYVPIYYADDHPAMWNLGEGGGFKFEAYRCISQLMTHEKSQRLTFAWS